MPTPMCSLTDVKPALNIRSNNPNYDTLLTNIILAAAGQIEDLCRQTFTYGARTEYYTTRQTLNRGVDLSGFSDTGEMLFGPDQTIILKGTPVDMSVPVAMWYDPRKLSFLDPETLVNTCDYFVDPDPLAGRILVRFLTRYAPYGLKISYSAGYQVGGDGTLSDALQAQAPSIWQASMLTVAHMWNRQNPDVLGSNEANEPGSKGQSRWNIVNSFGVPQEAQALLAPYRRLLTGRL